MNGRDIPEDHGFPVRAIVPGHYGMASVKWLTHIQAVREAFQGYWQTSDYGYWDDLDGKPVRRPLGEIKLKSQISRPRVYETVAPECVYMVFGAAWAGETEVTEIGVSTDGGATWAQGEFIDPPRRYAWRRWKYDWLTPATPGRYTLLAQAKGADGSVQPDKHEPNYGTYVIDHPLPIEVFVDELRGNSMRGTRNGRGKWGKAGDRPAGSSRRGENTSRVDSHRPCLDGPRICGRTFRRVPGRDSNPSRWLRCAATRDLTLVRNGIDRGWGRRESFFSTALDAPAWGVEQWSSCSPSLLQACCYSGFVLGVGWHLNGHLSGRGLLLRAPSGSSRHRVLIGFNSSVDRPLFERFPSKHVFIAEKDGPK